MIYGNNSYGVFAYGQLEPFVPAPGVGVDVPITGVQATGQVGDPAEITGTAVVVPASVEADGQAGNVAVQAIGNISVNLLEVNSQGQVGDLLAVVGPQININGVFGTGQVGGLTVQTELNATIPLSGVNSQGQIGNLAIITDEDAAVNISGNSAVGILGGLSVATGSANANVPLLGVSALGRVGNIQASVGGWIPDEEAVSNEFWVPDGDSCD